MIVTLADGNAGRLDDVMSVMTAAFDKAFGEAWTRSQCAGILPMTGVSLVLAEEDGTGQPLGFALYRCVAGDAELLLLAVAPQAQGMGVGRKLLQRFVDDATSDGADRIHLEVRDGNDAIRLYESAGFAPAGRRPKYYRGSDGSHHDALTFMLER